MMIQAVLSNPSHPEYGVATIPFPIPHDQYAHCIKNPSNPKLGFEGYRRVSTPRQSLVFFIWRGGVCI